MVEDFQYDAFLSYGSDDKAVVSGIAKQLERDGLRIWFDEWCLQPGDSIISKIEDGLDKSRILVLFMSQHAFLSEWSKLESYTFRFRDPLNKTRRFIPVRLDLGSIPSSLEQFVYIDFTRQKGGDSYKRLLQACRAPVSLQRTPELRPTKSLEPRLRLGAEARAYAFDSNGFRSVMGDSDGYITVRDLSNGNVVRELKTHTGAVWCAAWSPDNKFLLTGGKDSAISRWDAKTSKADNLWLSTCDGITRISFLTARKFLASSGDGAISIYDLGERTRHQIYRGGTWLASLDVSENGRCVAAGGSDGSIVVVDVDGYFLRSRLSGHSGPVTSIALNKAGNRLLSGSHDGTLRLWELGPDRCERVLEGHTGKLHCVSWGFDEATALSGASDGTVRLWDLNAAAPLAVLPEHRGIVRGLAWRDSTGEVISGDEAGVIKSWNLGDIVAIPPKQRSMKRRAKGKASVTGDRVLYTNAKVLLVGESGSGKTGLSIRLASDEWRPTDSTAGAWATHWSLPVQKGGQDVEREIWLWDFGGQADQRLVHQLYMDDTALAALVFDGQKEDVFETLAQWDRDLTRASAGDFKKLLVAGRVDVGGIRSGKERVKEFSAAHGFDAFLETSAKTGEGCNELKNLILNGIDWDRIPWRSSPTLFKRLKEEIVRLKDEGRVLMRVNELRETLQMRLSADAQFSDEELAAVVGLLTGPGVVWELEFGSWILLQPERINAYAQAVIQTMRKDALERGCILESRVLAGDLDYGLGKDRLDQDEEPFVLLAMDQLLVERGICLREQSDQGPLLIFPSYYRRERPELAGHPAVLVSYQFEGYLDEIYATLVVRLHHTNSFVQDQLWRYAADFKTLTSRQLGVKLTRNGDGGGELEVYFDPSIPLEEKIIFSKYVHEHLLQKAQNVIRLRHFLCPHCGTEVGNRAVAMRKLAEGKKSIPCINCDDPRKRVPLWDELEELFASEETKVRVRELQAKSEATLDNESKGRVLVGDVISTVALAGQICREIAVSDHGIDMEVEFKTDDGRASGHKVYLQLKSGSSYLSKRERDGAEIFRIPSPRHAEYWRVQKYPVILLIRNSEGSCRWMEIREYLERESNGGKQQVRQIEFKGERFDVMSVRRWREWLLQ